jgi:hypothetical protein
LNMVASCDSGGGLMHPTFWLGRGLIATAVHLRPDDLSTRAGSHTPVN